MQFKKIYYLVKEILTGFPKTRDSDKELLWAVWQREGKVKWEKLDHTDFLTATTPESVTRARRKVQQLNVSLRATVATQRKRKEKQQTKGKYIYSENSCVFVPDNE